MSSLTSLISGGGGGGSKIQGEVIDVSFTSATTISCPSGKSFRILGLLQINQSTNTTHHMSLSLSMGSRTIFSNRKLGDRTGYWVGGADTSFQGIIHIGPSDQGNSVIDHLDGKVDEDIVITGVSRTGSPIGFIIYTVLEDA